MARENLIMDKKVIKRMGINEEGNSFITIKGHKENFDNHPAVRLINPATKEQINIGQNQQNNQSKSPAESMEKYRRST